MKTYTVRREREENQNRLYGVANKGNVLSLIPQGNTGGIERLCLDMARHETESFYFYFMWGGGLSADEISRCSKNVVIRNFTYFKFFREYRYLKNYVISNNINVLLIQVPSPVFLFYSRWLKHSIKNLKICMYIHADPNAIFNTQFKCIQYRLFQKNVDGCIAISDFVANEMKENYPGNKITVIHNGIDLRRFSYVKKERTKSPMHFIFAGRLVKEKGLDILLHSLASIDKDYRVSLVGEGPCKDDLCALSISLNIDNRVEFLGERSDVELLLQGADFFVHPATCNEGFGIALVEAMASGVPCIAYSKGAIPEIIEDNKEGLLVWDYSIEEYRKRLLDAIDLFDFNYEQYLMLCDNARTKAEKYDINRYIIDLKDYLYSL